MTTPPPPPGPAWPTNPPVTPARQPWWTGGRITVAVVVVVLLMGGAAAAGFVAGLAVGGASTVVGDDAFDFGGGAVDDVPGATPLDTPVAEGADLQPGGRVNGVVGDRPVAHELDLPAGGSIELEITEANFDTVLVVLDADGRVVQSDDDGGQDRLSLVSTSLPPGTYTVRVQGWGSGDGGGYTLVAR